MFSKIIFLCFALKLISGSILQQIKSPDVDCYDTSTKSIHEQFAAKTAYSKVKGDLEPVHEGCTPEKIWLLIRHGAIYPSSSAIIELAALGNLRDSIVEPNLCKEDKALLTGWSWVANTTDHPEALSNEGWKDMKTLANDYADVYGDLFETRENVLFRHTAEQRNNDSIYGFATALFEGYRLDNKDSDVLLKFYETCDEWKDNTEKLNDADSELSNFEKSPLFTETIKGISDRLGMSDLLTVKQIKNIWDMCRFESAWDTVNSSAWCSAFSQAHVEVLEYHEDIELFYKTGHGREINSRLACKTVVDLIDHLNSNVTTTEPKVLVSVSDETTIQLFLTALGTHKDDVPPSTDDMEDMGNRRWKSSQMSPYAANLAVIKYECNSEHQVKFFLNQKKLDLDWCSGGVCKFNKFLETYQSFKDANCTEYFCPERSGRGKIEHGVLAITASLILIYLH